MATYDADRVGWLDAAEGKRDPYQQESIRGLRREDRGG